MRITCHLSTRNAAVILLVMTVAPPAIDATSKSSKVERFASKVLPGFGRDTPFVASVDLGSTYAERFFPTTKKLPVGRFVRSLKPIPPKTTHPLLNTHIKDLTADILGSVIMRHLSWYDLLCLRISTTPESLDVHGTIAALASDQIIHRRAIQMLENVGNIGDEDLRALDILLDLMGIDGSSPEKTIRFTAGQMTSAYAHGLVALYAHAWKHIGARSVVYRHFHVPDEMVIRVGYALYHMEGDQNGLNYFEDSRGMFGKLLPGFAEGHMFDFNALGRIFAFPNQWIFAFHADNSPRPSVGQEYEDIYVTTPYQPIVKSSKSKVVHVTPARWALDSVDLANWKGAKDSDTQSVPSFLIQGLKETDMDPDHGYWAYASLPKNFKYQGFMESVVEAAKHDQKVSVATFWKWVHGEALRNGDVLGFDVVGGQVVVKK